MDAATEARVAAWLRLDQNTETRAEIAALARAGAFAELRRRLGKDVAFGTAGLRAKMEAGFAAINCLTIVQASQARRFCQTLLLHIHPSLSSYLLPSLPIQGLASYLARSVPNALQRGVVVGHDHRHNSEIFARLTAGVFLHYGFKVIFYKTIVHTPMVPFAIQHLNLAGGVMITASHNPKQDNGYKVYWENSCQIIPPHDEGIAAEIARLRNTVVIWDATLCDTHPNCTTSNTESLKDVYFGILSSSLLSTPRNILSSSPIKYAYTAMHGVGLSFAVRVLRDLGLPAFTAIVKEQAEPDPDFPTVVFPNPEEKGALDLATALAESQGVPLVFANDPDADRFAAAEYLPGEKKWFVFTGDQIGALLAYSVVQRLGSASSAKRGRVAMINSAVSSKMLRSICLREGFRYEETLTGFKWMSNKAVQLRDSGAFDIFFVYEEAIGFMTHPCVLDKDGVSALATFAELAVLQYAKNQTMHDLLEQLYETYGFHASNNHYFICHDPAVISRIFKDIRFGSNSGNSIPRSNIKRESDNVVFKYPLIIGGFSVTYIRDLTAGFEMSDVQNVAPKYKENAIKAGNFVPTLPVSASSEMITFELENECVVTLRTSGTEPKIKYYIEKKGKDRKLVKSELDGVVKAVGEELFEATKNGLI